MSPYLYGGRNRRGDALRPSPNERTENGQNATSETPSPFDATTLNDGPEPVNGVLRQGITPNHPFDATFPNGGSRRNGELGQVNGDTPLNGHPFDVTRLNNELEQVNSTRQVRLDAGERLATTLTSEYPSSFSIDQANRSVHIRIHDEQGRVLYSRTLSNGDASPNERFTIFDSDRMFSNVIEYYGSNSAHRPQLHQTIYAGDIDTIMRNYDQVMNGYLDDEARERQLNSYLLEHRVYRISINAFRIVSYDSDGNEGEYIYRLDR